jgi:menaquinone-specific isochorismate synthase
LDRDLFASLVLSSVASNVNADDQGFQWVEPEESIFRGRFETIQTHMREQGLKKGVPVVFAEARGELSLAAKMRIFQRLFDPARAVPSNLHVYGIWGPSFGMIGATPEILFEQKGNDLETVALAGTLAKTQESGTRGGDLLEDPKERHEHQLVIDDLREVLTPLGDVRVGATEVLELPTLYHLRTSIWARLREWVDFDELVKRLHPTPALGVAPRSLGFREMQTWDEPEVRWRFGAPFGVRIGREEWLKTDCDDGRLDARGGGRDDGAESGLLKSPSGEFEIRKCVVAIRNIQWQDQIIRLGSGCGVVPQSDPVREWQELRAKRDSVKRLLGV